MNTLPGRPARPPSPSPRARRPHRAPRRPTLLLTLVALLLAGCGAFDGGAAGWPAGEGTLPLFDDLERFSGLGEHPRAGASDAFWEAWGDGRAELSGYRMTVTRYGAPRPAELALIYVTEPHDRRSWIKDDGAEGRNRVEVLKLNQNVEFMTGIYPYSVMTSIFAPVEPWFDEPFTPVRVTHAVQEWCGAYSHLVWPAPGRFRSLRLSYFEHEGETLGETRVARGTLYEDALLIQLRELDGPFADGGDWEGELVPELWRLRTGHRGTEPVAARIIRDEGTWDHAGTEVAVTRFTLEAGDYRRVFRVERDAPRRILSWETSTGESAELIATERLAYWELNRPGDEAWRERLGLSPRGSLPPGTDPGPAGGCAPG